MDAAAEAGEGGGYVSCGGGWGGMEVGLEGKGTSQDCYK